TWQAVVPLSQGPTAGEEAAVNEITVTAADEHGNVASPAARFRVFSVGEAGRVRKVSLDTVYRGCVVEGDVDTFQFEATAGTSVSITLEGTGRLELRDPWGETVEFDGEELRLAATGLYTLRVLPDGTGAYELTIDGTVPRSVVRTTATLSGPSDEDAYALCSVAGGVLSARAQGEFGPAHLAVQDPAGRTVAEADSLLRGLLLPVTGDYSVVVSGEGEMEYGLTALVRQPDVPVMDSEGPMLLGHQPSSTPVGALLELTVSGVEDDSVVVLLDGKPLQPEAIALSDGAGSLSVRVPAGTPRGSHRIQILSGGERSLPHTIEVTD
ncbi:MAG: PPC domain-containing protein, partial [Candidatus Brocadiia bacterium]